MCRWRARRPGACRGGAGRGWRILSAWWRLKLSALSVVSSLTCSRVKTLRSSTALGRGGTSSVLFSDGIGHLPQLGAVASTILQKAPLIPVPIKRFFVRNNFGTEPQQTREGLFSPEPVFRQKSLDVRGLAKMVADRFGCHWPGFGVRIAEPIRKLRQKVFTASLYVERFIAALQSLFCFFQNQRCRTGTPPARSFLRRVLNRWRDGIHADEKHRRGRPDPGRHSPHLTPLAIDRGRISLSTNLSAAAGHHRRSHGRCRWHRAKCNAVRPRSSLARTSGSGCSDLDVILERDTFVASLSHGPLVAWVRTGRVSGAPGRFVSLTLRHLHDGCRSSAHDLLESPFVERSHSLMSESTRTRARSSMIGIGSCLRCCSSRVAACPPVIFTASSPPAA